MKRMKNRTKTLAALVAAGFACTAFAAVSVDEAKLLGTTLTLNGAERAGNKDGTIPEYSGAALKAPASFDPKYPMRQPSPFADEKPLFTITAQNYTKYADKLDGTAELFKRFPNFKMDIYPTHRNYLYPKWVLENTAKNATACKTDAAELKLEGCYAGFPFPIPKTGNQAMWNHLLQFEQRTYGGKNDNQVVPTSGPASQQVLSFTIQDVPFYDPDRKTPWPSDAPYWRVRVDDKAPGRRAGGSTLVIDSLDPINPGRRAWQYIPGQRRVKLAPDLAYDTPSPYSGGAATMDDQKGFLGALDRFDFKLVGKKEKYIMYNNYELVDNKVCTTDKLTSTKNFANPECIRWELHRVWVVEATLKPGFRHIYKKRVFFWDEDVPGAGTTESYDASGKLYRNNFMATYPIYTTPGSTGGIAGSMFWYTDLQTGIWGSAGTGTCTDPDCGTTVQPQRDANYFVPEAMAGSGIR